MPGAPVFSVIIPVFNRWSLTEQCLRSLKEQTPGYDFEVIVADNASSDRTAADLEPLGKSLFGARFTRLRFEENRNYGPACNAGAEVAAAPLLFFLNNDTLMTPGWAAPLLEELEDAASLGAVGPLLLYPDDTVQHLGVAFSFGTVEHLYSGFPKEHPVAAKKRRLRTITAAAFLIRKELFLSAGGFFKGFRNGFEDLDLCLRLAESGYAFTCVPASVVYHLESQSEGRELHMLDNSTLLLERCGHLLRPDKHKYLLQDGFIPFIPDGWEIKGLLPPEESERLCEQAEGASGLALFEMLQRHPWWQKGWEMLVSVFEREGEAKAALFACKSLARMLGTCEAYANVVKAAIKAGDAAERERAERFFAIACDSRQDTVNWRRWLRKAGKDNDAWLERNIQARLKMLEEDRASGTDQR